MSDDGHCLCGEVRWHSEGPRIWQAYCHCESCRRSTGAPVTAYLAVPRGGVSWTGRPRAYASSPGVTRYFCGACGTPLAYAVDSTPEEIHFHVATLAQPQSFRPERHDFDDERLPWLVLDDGLPRHRGDDQTGE